MKIEEVFSLIENPDDWQSQVDVDKMWDIIRNNPTKRRELEPFRLDRETDKPYAELGQLQKDLFKTMLSKTMWRILKAQRTQPSARNLQREIEHLNRRIGVSEEGMEEDAKDDPHAANTEVANANPAQAPKAGNPAQAGTAPTAGATVPTVGKPGDPAKSAASNMQRIAANATGQTAAAQQALAGAKETVPVLPSDRTKAQQDKLDAAKEKVLGLGLDNALGESQMESDDPAIGDVVIMELANGRAIHAHVAETRGRSLVLALDETAMQWLEEAPDHEHLKITGSGMVSPVAKVWNSMIDDLEYDTPEGWAAMFRARTQDKESARKWGRLWRQQHINLGDDLSLDDQRAWEQAVSNKLHEMDQGLEEKAHVIAKSLNSKDRVLTKIYMDARRNGTPLKKYSQELAVKAGMPIDHYWNKIKPLVNEEELNEADAHVMLWPVIERVLGRKLYKGKNAADLYSSHTDHGIEIHGAVTRGLTGNEELELEQALHKAGIPIERVKIEPDMIRIDLRGEMDEAMPDVLGMSEDTSDPYSTQTKYYIVRKNAGLNAIPGKSGSHTMAAARKQLAKMPDKEDFEIRAINTTKIPQQQPQPEVDEAWIKSRIMLTPSHQEYAPVDAEKPNLNNIVYQLRKLTDYRIPGTIHFDDSSSIKLDSKQARMVLDKIAKVDQKHKQKIIKSLQDSKHAFVAFVRGHDQQQEIDEGLVDTLKVLALLGLGAYGINASLDSMNAPNKTPLGQALTVAAQHGDKSAAKYLANLDAYIEANDTNTLAMLKDSYLDGPKAAVKESNPSTNTRTWIDPATYDALSNLQQHRRELDALKPEPTSNYVRPEEISISYIKPTEEMIKHWAETHDREWALDHAINWGTRSLPKALKQELRQDPTWQAIALELWAIAEYHLQAKRLGPSANRSYGPGYSRLDRVMGDDVGAAVATERKLFHLIAKYRRKFGIDKTGRQLPPHELARRQPGDEPGADWRELGKMEEAEYHGREVKLGKPMRTNTGEGGKFKVYVRDPKSGNIKMVRFGDTTGLSIKRDDPKRRKSFRARHHCDNPGPRTKARFWSCRMWTRKPVGKILKGK